MKRLLFVCFALAVLSSCRLTRYDRIPGTAISSFPAELQGNYMLKANKGENSTSDSNYLKITATAVDISDPKLKVLLVLNDTNKLSTYKDMYFFASRTEEPGTKEWFIYPVKIKGDKVFVYTIGSGKIQKKLEKYLKLKEGTFNSYIMNDELFYKFCKKKLKKRNSFEMVKMKP